MSETGRRAGSSEPEDLLCAGLEENLELILPDRQIVLIDILWVSYGFLRYGPAMADSRHSSSSSSTPGSMRWGRRPAGSRSKALAVPTPVRTAIASAPPR